MSVLVAFRPIPDVKPLHPAVAHPELPVQNWKIYFFPEYIEQVRQKMAF